jgi:hypothetical protein
MFWNDPPTSLPSGAITLPPIRKADTKRFRRSGFLSISWAISWTRMNVPCEWPMRMNPRPLLYCEMYVFQASRALW